MALINKPIACNAGVLCGRSSVRMYCGDIPLVTLSSLPNLPVLLKSEMVATRFANKPFDSVFFKASGDASATPVRIYRKSVHERR